MPTTPDLELTPDQHVALDTIVSSDEHNMARMEDWPTVDGIKVPFLGSDITILNQNAGETPATPAFGNGTPSFLPSPIKCGIPIVSTFQTSILQSADV